MSSEYITELMLCAIILIVMLAWIVSITYEKVKKIRRTQNECNSKNI